MVQIWPVVYVLPQQCENIAGDSAVMQKVATPPGYY